MIYMKKRVITFGEIMMRLSAPGQTRLSQTQQLNIVYGGSEANVAVSLAQWGVPTEHVTRLPDHDLGDAVCQHLKKYGVSVAHVLRTPGRLGLYFLENGAMQRPPRIIYDRYDSAFAHIQPGTIDWQEILKDASWFHWTGITPAISRAAAAVCLEAVQAAAALGVTVSGDINYRRNLWQYGETPTNVMPELVKSCSVIVGGLADFRNCLGIDQPDYESGCRAVMEQFPAVTRITYTNRHTISASHNAVQGILVNRANTCRSPVYDLTHIVDRVGAGDAYMAGLIYGWLHGWSDEKTVGYAAAACAWKHSVEGDVNLCTVQEIEALMNGENTGKLLR